MAGHHLHQHVEVSDDGRTVAAAEVIISGEPGGTARVSLRAEAGTSLQAAARAWSTRCWTFPRCGKARAWRRHSRSAMASHCCDFSSAARTSPPARRGAAPCWMRAFRPAARARGAGAERPGTCDETWPAFVPLHPGERDVQLVVARLAQRAVRDAVVHLERPGGLATVEFQVFHHQVCAIGAPRCPMITQCGRTAGLLHPAA